MKNRFDLLKPVKPSRAVARSYARDIQKLIKDMVKDYYAVYYIYRDERGQLTTDAAWVTTSVEERFKKLGDKWQRAFQDFADGKSEDVIREILKQTDLQLKSILQDYLSAKYFTIIGSTVPKTMRIMMKAQLAENVALIKSIPQDFHHRVEGAVYRAITGEGTLKRLRDDIAHYGNMSLRRAKLISSDQTTKIFNVLAIQRMKQVGITKYRWVHTHRGKTQRPYHERKWDGVSGLNDGRPNGLNGFVFSLENPPVIDPKTGERGLPGRLAFCYHRDTEVYTERGFVPIKDVIKGEKILTLNPDTRVPEWSECISTTKRFTSNIVNLNGRWLKLSVDPEHRFFMYRETERGRKPVWFRGVEQVAKRHLCFYGSSEWIGVEQDTLKIDGKDYPMDDFLRLLAYYLTEGSVDRRPARKTIFLSQYSHKDKMFENLSLFNPVKVKGGINIYDKTLNQYFRQFGHAQDKFIPDWVGKLSKRQIRIFLDAFQLGDGAGIRQRLLNGVLANIYPVYRTSSKKMAHTLCELVIKTGMSVSCRVTKQAGKKIIFKGKSVNINFDIYTVAEKKSKYFRGESLKLELEEYNDYTYDIGVEKNHTLLIKFGSSIHWNSNCHCEVAPVIAYE